MESGKKPNSLAETDYSECPFCGKTCVHPEDLQICLNENCEVYQDGEEGDEGTVELAKVLLKLERLMDERQNLAREKSMFEAEKSAFRDEVNGFDLTGSDSEQIMKIRNLEQKLVARDKDIAGKKFKLKEYESMVEELQNEPSAQMLSEIKDLKE